MIVLIHGVKYLLQLKINFSFKIFNLGDAQVPFFASPN